MRKSTVSVNNRLGLHARAAARLVRLAEEFKSRIILIKHDESIFANAKSILSVLSLAASQGASLGLEVEGEDEDAAHQAIEEMFLSGFGEAD